MNLVEQLVIERRVAKEQSNVEAMALRISREGQSRRAMAEYDDLLQEGMLQAWLNIKAGRPTMYLVEFTMREYVRTVGRQIGIGRLPEKAPEHIQYEDMTPLDEQRLYGEES